MKVTTLFTLLALILTINGQAQNIVFSNETIGEDVKESTQTEFTLGEDEIFQRAYFSDFVTYTYECRRCNLYYFISLNDEILGRMPTTYANWNPKIAKEKKSHSSSMILNPEQPMRSEPGAAQSLFEVITKGGLEPNKSYEIKVEIFVDENREVISTGSFTLNTPDEATLEAFMTPYESQFLKPTWIKYDLPFKAQMTDSKIEKTLVKVANANTKGMVYDVDLKISKAYIMTTADDWKGDDGNGTFPVVLFAKGSDGKCYRIEATYGSVMKNGKSSKAPVLKSKNAFEVPCVIANKYL